MSNDLKQDVIYWHPHYSHTLRNINKIHKEENLSSFNQKFAVFLTKNVGSMYTAYAFAVLALIGLLSILGVINPTTALLVTWLSQTFIQLVLLPVIMVGQNVLNKHSELQADETFKVSQKSFHDIEHIIKHLDAQDKELLKQTEILLSTVKKVEEQQQILARIAISSTQTQEIKTVRRRLADK